MRSNFQDLSIIQTLDNPKVLEQQLEALEHHKKVLERREQYQKLIHDRASSSQELNERLTPINCLKKDAYDSQKSDYANQDSNSKIIYSNILKDGIGKSEIQPSMNAHLSKIIASKFLMIIFR